jgi:hypothetical protein
LIIFDLLFCLIMFFGLLAHFVWIWNFYFTQFVPVSCCWLKQVWYWFWRRRLGQRLYIAFVYSYWASDFCSCHCTFEKLKLSFKNLRSLWNCYFSYLRNSSDLKIGFRFYLSEFCLMRLICLTDSVCFA